MGGCTQCSAKTGCDHRKGEMLESVAEALARLYPQRTWGCPDDGARFGGGISEEDAHALAEELSSELEASTFFRPGTADEYCDYIYVLCVGREPTLVQVRDGDVPLPAELDGEVIHEQYLRVCLSNMAPFAVVQQTSMELEFSGGQGIVVEKPRPGVYDAPLLRRLQRLVATLPAYGLVHLDMGEISAPPADFSSGGYGALFGGEPHTVNYLFYPQPSTTQSTVILSPSGH